MDVSWTAGARQDARLTLAAVDALMAHRAAHRRPLRGFACVRMLLVTAALMGLSIIGAAGLGHVLVERDDAVERARDAELRETKCERGWHATNVRAAVLREEVAEHLAIEEDGPCVCSVVP